MKKKKEKTKIMKPFFNNKKNLFRKFKINYKFVQQIIRILLGIKMVKIQIALNNIQ